jgi:putative colanic acid biosysnthesis UDP-glucose lipid carrier transferase
MALRRRTIIILIFIIDLLALNVSLGLTSLWHYNKLIGLNELVYLLNANWAIVYTYSISDRFFNTEGIKERSIALFKRILLYLFLGSFWIVVLNMDDISRTMFIGSTLAFLGFKLILSIPYNYLVTHRKDGGYFNKILIIGANRIGEAIATYYKLNSERGQVIGFLDNWAESTKKITVLGKIEDFQKVFDAHQFHEVVIALDFSKADLIKSLVERSEYNGVRPGVVGNYYSLFNRNFNVKDISGIPILEVREVPLDSYVARIQKRLFDLIFSFFVLLFASPILLLIGLAIKLDSKGPVFYRPVRVGKRGQPISIYKFRSMRHGPNDPTKSTTKNDDRITRVGKFIRKASLDEFPQFINVLLGDMSVVGPRPHRLDLNKKFQKTAQNYMVRQYIKPGITGWAQVNGWRGPTENRFQYVARTLHDLWYVEHWTFALDLYIIYLTVFSKKTRTNAF